jgi:hypothetical protein
MTSSTSSSSKLTAVLAAAAMLAASTAGCAIPRRKPSWARGGEARVAIFPPDNLTGGEIDAAQILSDVERAVARTGVQTVTGATIDEFLAAHRIRYTGGIDQDVAKAARDELAVDAVLITSVEVYSPGPPPRVGMTLRLVTAADDPEVLWIDGAGQSGDDTVGLLGLGGIGTVDALHRKVIERIARSMAAFVAGKGPRGTRCDGRAPFRPRLAYRLASFELGPDVAIAALPFVNETKRGEAGEVVALHFLRQLATIPGVRIVEPGLVRRQLLEFRLIMPGGVSLDQASTMLKMLRANLVVSGYVRRFQEAGAPRIDFTTLVLDRRRESIVWESTSYGQGDDGVVLFDFGTVNSPSNLLCAMAGSAVGAFHASAESEHREAADPAASASADAASVR